MTNLVEHINQLFGGVPFPRLKESLDEGAILLVDIPMVNERDELDPRWVHRKGSTIKLDLKLVVIICESKEEDIACLAGVQ